MMGKPTFDPDNDEHAHHWCNAVDGCQVPDEDCQADPHADAKDLIAEVQRHNPRSAR